MPLARVLKLFGMVSVLMTFGLALFLELRPIVSAVSIKPEDIGKLSGYGYAITLPRAPGWPLLSWNGDDYETRRSTLRLFENGQALSEPHASQVFVQDQGAGRYLHLREVELYFSTSDNSDPRVNGRAYTLRAAASPRAGLTFSLFVGAVIVCAVGLHTHPIKTHFNRIVWLGPVVFTLVTATWVARIWTPAPLILDTGDAGNVASIAAGWLFRENFAGDPILSDGASTTFYLALIVPITMALTVLTHDVGQAYALLTVPILLLQMWGFYLLGMRFFRSRAWAIVLALATVPPVYVFGGELWGNLAMPLTRSMFGAIVPFLILYSLARDGSYVSGRCVSMLLCGLAVYVHPVSAPTVAFACWLGMLVDKPSEVSHGRHLGVMTLSGLIFVLLSTPFAYVYVASLPTGSDAGDLAANAMKAAAGAQYFDALGIGKRVVFSGWGWRWIVWIGGIAALFLIPRRFPQAARDARFLRAFLVGILVASIGVAWLDQAVAAQLGRNPLQIDLVRNVRFFVPVLLIAFVWLLALKDAESGQRTSGIPFGLAGVVMILMWWHKHPTPPVIALGSMLGAGVPAVTIHEADRQILAHVSRLPESSKILPLPAPIAETKPELVALAIRYGAHRSVAFLGKDLNFLSYSSSATIGKWLEMQKEIARIGTERAADIDTLLLQITRREDISHVLLHLPSASPTLLLALQRVSRTVAESTGWRLLSIEPAKSIRSE